MTPGSDFYVGYQDKAPAGLARFVRGAVVVLGLSAVSIAAVVTAVQERFDPGVFEFGVVRTFEGVIEAEPHPVLLVDEPASQEQAVSRFYLVGTGKRGAPVEVAALDGRRVRLEGSLIYRDGETMIEVGGGLVDDLGTSSQAGRGSTRDLGVKTLVGEIVDSKCFFGVMKPGRGKPHRACATRCISGGVPPVLRVETDQGMFRHYLLADQDGGKVNERVLDRVAEPIQITGKVTQRDNLLFLEADPATYVRIGEM